MLPGMLLALQRDTSMLYDTRGSHCAEVHPLHRGCVSEDRHDSGTFPVKVCEYNNV